MAFAIARSQIRPEEGGGGMVRRPSWAGGEDGKTAGRHTGIAGGRTTDLCLGARSQHGP